MLGNCCDRPELDGYQLSDGGTHRGRRATSAHCECSGLKPTHSPYQVDPFQTLALVMDQLDRRSNLSY